MTSQFDEFDQKGKNPERNTGSIISHALEMYKGVFLYGFVIMIITFVADYVLQILTGFSIWSNAENFRDLDDAEGMLWRNSNMKFYYSSSGLLNVLLTPLYLGLIYISNKFNNQQQIDFSDIFIGYRQNLPQTLIYGLISTIVFYISLAMCGFPFLFVFPLFILGLPFLLFENLSATEAIGKSFSIAKQEYSVFLGVGILGGLLSISGLILCCIGIIFTIPFIYVVMYSAYCAYCGKPRQL